MIMKNEAHNLPILFESIKDCFDEVCITDTGSTDGSVELAQSFGAKVSHFEWVNDFSAARNFNFEQATSDYVMWMDLDDCLGNPEAFKAWRDSVMNMADYWMATYHYAFDKGQPVCSFVRERVVKRDRGFKWKYFVHEGIIPHSELPVKAQFTQSFTVNHRRTSEDLARDKGRNVSLFKGREDSLDSRMKYYYGKELFENQDLDGSITWLSKALVETDLETHDRLLAMQYLCHALQAKKGDENMVKAASLAHQGLLLAPNRAEFFNVLGDFYVMQKKYLEARPFYEAAKACVAASGGMQPVFSSLPHYNWYPKGQIVKILATTGQMDAAEVAAAELYKETGSAEAKQWLAEAKSANALRLAMSSPQVCDDIVITCLFSPYEWDPGVYSKRAMGGSETAAIEMANWLAKKSGKRVIVFNPRKDEASFDGVLYLPHTKIPEYFKQNKPFLHIAWRHTEKLTDALTYCWSHDLTTPGVERLDNYYKILALTPFHKTYLQSHQGIPPEKIHVTRNGLNPEKFVNKGIEKDPFKFVFSSSPDRGLDRAMRVLDRVRVKYPEVKLHVYYGIEHLKNYGPEMEKLGVMLKGMMDDRKDWVIYHGATEQRKLMEEFQSAAYCVAPADWIETSCISALERACCGVYQIFRGVGGVVDTLKPISDAGMATIVNSDCITDVDHDVYAAKVIEAMDQEAYKRVKVDAHNYAWERVAEEWLRELPFVK